MVVWEGSTGIWVNHSGTQGREESTSGCLGVNIFLQRSKLDRNGD